MASPSSSVVKDMDSGTGKKDIRVYSSKRVGDTLYNLVSCPKNGTAEPSHQESPDSSQPSPARVGSGPSSIKINSKARKSFTSSSMKAPHAESDVMKQQLAHVEAIKSASHVSTKEPPIQDLQQQSSSKKRKLMEPSTQNKILLTDKPSTLISEPSGTNEELATLDRAEKKTLLDSMKKSYTSPNAQPKQALKRSAFSESETSSCPEEGLDGTRKHKKPATVRKEVPGLIHINTHEEITKLGPKDPGQSLQKSETLLDAVHHGPIKSSKQDQISAPPVQSPPTPAPTPGPPPLPREEQQSLSLEDSLEERMVSIFLSNILISASFMYHYK